LRVSRGITERLLANVGVGGGGGVEEEEFEKRGGIGNMKDTEEKMQSEGTHGVVGRLVG
jgi:hypothetical protein